MRRIFGQLTIQKRLVMFSNTGCTAGRIGSLRSVGSSRVKLGSSHLPWSRYIEGTRDMEILKIHLNIFDNMAVFDFFLVGLDPPSRFMTQGAVINHQVILRIKLGSILSLGTRNPIHR
jgi:hypothetical protein